MKAVSVFCLAAVVFLACTAACFGQSITSGDIVGTVTDPSGAVVPNAKVTATNDATSSVHTTTSNGEGFYRFSFLAPGTYTVAVSAGGFQPKTRKIQVAVGDTANGNIALTITGGNVVVEVTTTPTTQIDTANISTNYSEQQIALVPNPGNDLSAVAQTSPGIVMNTQSGFGNFSSFGLPGTSNLFTLDGQNDNDPFLNLNNSGATNLLLGANEIQEATVTSNGYSGQYGQLAGAQVNYVTKSGGNQYHGNAVYYWNGRTLNANDFLNNEVNAKRPFDNVNQWAASFGGPIVKDKTFFFWDYEGLRVVLPTSSQTLIPDPNFAAATLAHVAPSQVPFFTSIFNLYKNAPGAASAVPITACSALATPVPIAGNCVDAFRSLAGNFTHEFLMALRIDQKFSENDSIFGRVQTDRGLQATFTDPINPVFNAQSNQPEYQGQLGWTHIVNSNQVNEFKVSGQWYSAIFAPANLSSTLSTFPTTLVLGDGSLTNLGGIDFDWPQGRNVTQYQAVDDYSWTHGNHTWKFGANFHRNLVSDFDPGLFTSGKLIVNSLNDLFNGGGTGDVLQQNFPTRLSQPISVYGLATYIQDEWRATKKLKLTLALRLDHNSNPVCETNCFARLVSPFTSLDHTDSQDVPYNSIIKTGFSQAYPGTDIVVWQPRLGFTYSPLANNKTVLRGGIGIFSDAFPANVADTLLTNAPTLAAFAIANQPVSALGTGGIFDGAVAANSAFQGGFATGGTPASLGLLGGLQPGFTTTNARVRQPRYQEWNLEVQQELPWNMVLSMNYVGNHGIFEGVQNNGLNGFGTNPLANGGAGFIFSGFPLPAANIVAGTANGPDTHFTAVNQIQSIGVSNYNGLVASLRHQFNRGFAFQVNYVWSHALDDVSNGGLLPFNNTTNVSPLNPINPFNIRANYGPADYDVRHYFSANYVWDNSLRHLFRWGPNAIFGGWTFSGTAFYRTGLPFSVVDGATTSTLAGQNFGAGYAVLAGVTGNPLFSTPNCGSGGASLSPCLNSGAFGVTGSTTGGIPVNQGRNSFRGPNYFDTDFTVMKSVKIRERASLSVGFQFFNLLNHPNFDQPVNNLAAGTFGTIVRSVNTPTSILGSFLGGDASPRLIQLKTEFKF